MEKIALIMNGGSRNMVISDKTVARLKTLGEVVINEGSTGKEDVIKAISGATVAITSWGNTGIDVEKGRARGLLRLPARPRCGRNGAGLYHLRLEKLL